MSDKDRQKVSEVGLQSVCQTVKCCLSSLSSLHHPLPIQNHTSLRGGSFLSSPAACKNWPRGQKEVVGKAGEERGGEYLLTHRVSIPLTQNFPLELQHSCWFNVCYPDNELG